MLQALFFIHFHCSAPVSISHTSLPSQNIIRIFFRRRKIETVLASRAKSRIGAKPSLSLRYWAAFMRTVHEQFMNTNRYLPVFFFLTISLVGERLSTNFCCGSVALRRACVFVAMLYAKVVCVPELLFVRVSPHTPWQNLTHLVLMSIM